MRTIKYKSNENVRAYRLTDLLAVLFWDVLFKKFAEFLKLNNVAW